MEFYIIKFRVYCGEHPTEWKYYHSKLEPHPKLFMSAKLAESAFKRSAYKHCNTDYKIIKVELLTIEESEVKTIRKGD